jgi:hypothetical protein
VDPVRHVAVTLFTAITLSAGLAWANAGNEAVTRSPYERICESSGLRSMERADCRAQMKLARDDARRREIYRVFDVRVNGALAGDPPALPADTAERTGG